MSPEEETCSMQVIDFCRTHSRKLGSEFAKIGARSEDIAIGALYSAFDLALAHTGDPIAAINWLRRGIDIQAEQFILNAETIQ